MAQCFTGNRCLYQPDSSPPDTVTGRVKIKYKTPARRAGEAILIEESINPLVRPRKAWQYLPGQRRVKLAPDIGYDTPNTGTAGSSTYDDAGLFNGAMDRFAFRLLGKQELFVPYNKYKLNFEQQPSDYVVANHLQPDFVRWELHRVWVVEATLKPAKRHVYQRRMFYLD